MIKSNFHTHTYFCDGKDSPEDMVIAAMAKGFTVLGFSGHGQMPIENDFAMTAKTEPLYRKEILRLKKKYSGKIKIFCGAELDYFNVPSDFKYDYIIGSVHYVFKDGHYIPVDLTADDVVDAVESFYGGDFESYAEDYYGMECEVVEKTGADIIGHIDLISKFFEIKAFHYADRYFHAAEKCVKKLAYYNIPFEINTGAMARGYRTDPYPSREILGMIKKYNGKIIISSDCHDKKHLDYAFDKAVNLAVMCGFSEHGVITEKGIEYIPF